VGPFVTLSLNVPSDYNDLSGSKRIVVRSADTPSTAASVSTVTLPLRAKGFLQVEFRAPSEPGRYVLEVWVGLNKYDEHTVDIAPASEGPRR
jgi:hypothetical protein